MTNALWRRVVDELGVHAVINAFSSDAADFESVISEFVAGRSPKAILRAAGEHVCEVPEEANHAATALLTRLVGLQLETPSDVPDRLLRQLVIHLGTKSACTDADDLIQTLVKEGNGDTVLQIHWQGGIGASGSMSFRQLGGQYWFYEDFSEYVSGPHRGLRKAVQDADVAITEATSAMETSSPAVQRIVLKMPVDAPEGHMVRLNGEEWEVGPNGKLVRTDSIE